MCTAGYRKNLSYTKNNKYWSIFEVSWCYKNYSKELKRLEV